METTEKIRLIEELVAHYKKISHNLDQVNGLFGADDSKFTDNIWNMFDAYVITTGKLIGDRFYYINWFIWDNGCGKDGKECIFEKRAYKIKTVKDLVKFMELKK